MHCNTLVIRFKVSLFESDPVIWRRIVVPATVLKLMQFWGPYLGAGVKVKAFAPDLTWIEIQMKKHWWNGNYHGTHFGGSLFSMTDPFFALILIHYLGKDYEVWLRSQEKELSLLALN